MHECGKPPGVVEVFSDLKRHCSGRRGESESIGGFKKKEGKELEARLGIQEHLPNKGETEELKGK